MTIDTAVACVVSEPMTLIGSGCVRRPEPGTTRVSPSYRRYALRSLCTPRLRRRRRRGGAQEPAGQDTQLEDAERSLPRRHPTRALRAPADGLRDSHAIPSCGTTGAATSEVVIGASAPPHACPRRLRGLRD